RYSEGAACLAAGAEPAEQVDVDEEIIDLVHGDAAVGGRSGALCVGEVLDSGTWVDPEPGANRVEGDAGTVGGDGEGVGDLGAGRSRGVQRQVGEHLDVVGLAFDHTFGVATCASVGRPEQGQLRKRRVRVEPECEGFVEPGVGIGDLVTRFDGGK